MLQDPNVESYVAEKIKPLQKQIKELKAEIKKLHQLNKSAVANKVCNCGNKLTEKELFYQTCLKCDKTV
jgi:hypothetical protein